MPDDYRLAMYTSLQLLRDGFPGRVHFTSLKDHGPAAETARRWVGEFFAQHIEFASFKATFALHDGPRRLPYPGEPDYQRHAVQSTSSNLVGHLRYVLKNQPLVAVRCAFDGTGNARERYYGAWGVAEARFRMNRRHRKGRKGYPLTQLLDPTFSSSDHRKAATLEEAITAEFLQFTDILLGASAQALNFLPTPGKLGRRVLASRVTDEIASRMQQPTYRFNRHVRHFSVSLYPDARGRMYAANPVKAPAATSGHQFPLSI